MELIHELDKKIWISRRKINLKELILERTSQLDKHKIIDPNDQVLLTDESRNNLRDELEKFAKTNEAEIKPYFLFNSCDEKVLVNEPNCKLKTYQLQLEHAKRMISDRTYKVDYLSKLQMTRKELLMRTLASTNRDQNSEQSNPEVPTEQSQSESITAVLVIQTWPQPCKNSNIKLEKEILFKASQPLTDLRDQFKCQRDYGVPMDLAKNPDQAERIYRGELFKSGFFLIGNTFYNDMRDKNNVDLSASIDDWARKEVATVDEDGKNVKISRGFGEFKRAKMEEHKFEDLEFRLGCPYLYLHQGDCEHLFTISDIRYFKNDVTLRQTKFPFITASMIGRKMDHLRCYMCKSRPPHWYTRNNRRLPVDPYFFCENCFYSFNYDKDRKMIGQFQAYLYTSTFGLPESVVMAAHDR